jgi:hypothetical protein
MHLMRTTLSGSSLDTLCLVASVSTAQWQNLPSVTASPAKTASTDAPAVRLEYTYDLVTYGLCTEESFRLHR